jgi:hypothetical protein
MALTQIDSLNRTPLHLRIRRRGMQHGMRRRSVMPNSSLWLTLPTFCAVEALEKAQAENEYIRKRYHADLLIGENSWRSAIAEWRPLAMLKTDGVDFEDALRPGELPDEAEKTHRHISTANMLRSMKSLWRFKVVFNKARLNVPPLASRWRLSDGRSFRLRKINAEKAPRQRR